MSNLNNNVKYSQVISKSQSDAIASNGELIGRSRMTNYVLEFNVSKELSKQIQHLEYSKNKYDSYDGTFIIDDTLYIFELKCRDMNSTSYNEFFMVEHKANFLKRLVNKTMNNLKDCLDLKKMSELFNIPLDVLKQVKNVKPLYYNFFNDAKGYVWDINSFNLGKTYPVWSYDPCKGKKVLEDNYKLNKTSGKLINVK